MATAAGDAYGKQQNSGIRAAFIPPEDKEASVLVRDLQQGHFRNWFEKFIILFTARIEQTLGNGVEMK